MGPKIRAAIMFLEEGKLAPERGNNNTARESGGSVEGQDGH